MIRIITIAVMCWGLVACNGIPPYDRSVQEKNAKMGQFFQHFKHDINGRIIHGVHTGKACNPAVIFIHGAPGDWGAWGRYLGDKNLTNKAFMISVDRLGYRGSGAGKPELSLEKQASAIIDAALKEHPGPFFLVGHSYGGPVQVQIAQDYSEHVSGMLILAGAIDPVIQKSRWYHYLAGTWLGRQVLSQALNVTTQEMLSLPAELKKQKKGLKKITAKTIVIQGGRDWLVPPGNAKYAQKNLKNADVRVISLPKQGHFIPWQRHGLVKSQILKSLEQGTCL